MIIDLKKFLVSDDYAENREYDLEINDIELSGVNPFKEPIKVKADIRSMPDSDNSVSILLTLDLKYTLHVPCDRCAEETTLDMHLTPSHLLVETPREDEEEHDDNKIILIEGEELDLDEIVYFDIVANLPTKTLCSKDCKGLCSKCGKNLNEGECSCEKTEIDPRLEVLKQLLDE